MKLRVLGVVVVLLGACGGSDGDEGADRTVPSTAEQPAPAPRSAPRAEAAVKRTVRRYFAAVVDLDAEALCAQLTSDQQDYIANSQSASDCPAGQRQAWRKVRRQLSPRTLRQIQRSYDGAKVLDVRVTGYEAEADIDIPPGAVFSGPGTISLYQAAGDGWRIDKPIELG
jgi:hypothetical protein